MHSAELDGVRLCAESTLKWAIECGLHLIARGHNMCSTELRWMAASVIEAIDAHSPTIIEVRALARAVVEPDFSLAADVAWDIDFPYASLRISDTEIFDEMVADLRKQMCLRSEVCGVPVMNADLPHVAKISLEDWQGNVLRCVTMSWHQADDDVEEVPVKEGANNHEAQS